MRVWPKGTHTAVGGVESLPQNASPELGLSIPTCFAGGSKIARKLHFNWSNPCPIFCNKQEWHSAFKCWWHHGIGRSVLACFLLLRRANSSGSTSHKQNFTFSKPLIWKFSTPAALSCFLYLKVFCGYADISLGHDELLTFPFLWLFLEREKAKIFSVSMPALGSFYSQWKLSSRLLFKQKSVCVVQLQQYKMDMERWHGVTPYQQGRDLLERQVERRVWVMYWLGMQWGWRGHQKMPGMEYGEKRTSTQHEAQRVGGRYVLRLAGIQCALVTWALWWDLSVRLTFRELPFCLWQVTSPPHISDFHLTSLKHWLPNQHQWWIVKKWERQIVLRLNDEEKEPTSEKKARWCRVF